MSWLASAGRRVSLCDQALRPILLPSAESRVAIGKLGLPEATVISGIDATVMALHPPAAEASGGDLDCSVSLIFVNHLQVRRWPLENPTRRMVGSQPKLPPNSQLARVRPVGSRKEGCRYVGKLEPNAGICRA